MESATVFAPPVSPRESNSTCVASLPTMVRPLRFGMLNVVDPSPVPYVVPTAANSAVFAERDMAEPSAATQPVGATVAAVWMTKPLDAAAEDLATYAVRAVYGIRLL